MEPETKSNGALLGSIVIVLILVIGGIYLWKTSTENKSVMQNEEETSSLNETSSLEADLNSTDLESMDSGI